MLYRCDRCEQLVEGFENEGGTGGFYYVDKGSWAQFARPYEVVLCDRCMWDDPKYIALYGRIG